MRNIRDKSILVIDDDARMLRALDKVLTGEGAVVTVASWAGDAVEILTAREKEFDLVITDLRMPFVNGLTVVYAVHKIYPQLPVIVQSAFGSPDIKTECIKQGAAAFLEKPLNSSELLDAVEQVFATHAGVNGEGEAGGGKINSTEGNSKTEMNRLGEPRRTSGQPDGSGDAGAGPVGRRKEQVYEQH